jgi:hypothetical protein
MNAAMGVDWRKRVKMTLSVQLASKIFTLQNMKISLG